MSSPNIRLDAPTNRSDFVEQYYNVILGTKEGIYFQSKSRKKLLKDFVKEVFDSRKQIKMLDSNFKRGLDENYELNKKNDELEEEIDEHKETIKNQRKIIVDLKRKVEERQAQAEQTKEEEKEEEEEEEEKEEEKKEEKEEEDDEEDDEEDYIEYEGVKYILMIDKGTTEIVDIKTGLIIGKFNNKLKKISPKFTKKGEQVHNENKKKVSKK